MASIKSLIEDLSLMIAMIGRDLIISCFYSGLLQSRLPLYNWLTMDRPKLMKTGAF